MKHMAVDPKAPASMKYGPMLLGISYDAGQINNTSSACPCAVTVGNTNYGGLEAAATVMYMNHLEVFGANRDTENFRLARHHLYQEIVVSIVSVVERAQRNGVLCSLPTGPNNEEETWTLLPVVAAAQFDTKERYQFFGNRAERTCAICSGPRKGRSVFRRGTPHANRWAEIQRLQHLADGGAGTTRKRKQAQLALERKGFHALKRCRLPLRCPQSLLSAPGRVFGGLVACDVLHAIFINWCSYYLTAVHDCVTPSMKQKMDQRLETLCGRFRDPETGQTSRAPKGAITSQVGLTAELRVLVVFLMMHVLGSQASILDTPTHERVREHVLMAGSSLVLILTAVRNKRPYTDREWDEIFGPVSMRFFRSLDAIRHWDNHRKVTERRVYNVAHPESPKKLNEFTCEARDPDDSSENSTDDEWRSFVGFFDRSRCILPHAVLHLKSQVNMCLTYPEVVYLTRITVCHPHIPSPIHIHALTTGEVGRDSPFQRRSRGRSKTPRIPEVTRRENTSQDRHTNRARLAPCHAGGTCI